MSSGASKLIPSDPEKVMVIRHLTPDVVTLSTPFLRFGRIKVGGRSTLVRLQSGSVAVFSPVALTDTVKKETETLGQLKYIIAPDQEHHIFLESWHKAYPEALVVGPATLPALRDKQSYSKIPFHHLSEPNQPISVSPEFDSEFDAEYVHGHSNKELVFNHRPSKTLIEADLLFNLPATEQFSKSGVSPTSGILTKIMNGLQSTKGQAIWQKRMLWYGIAEDKKAMNASMATIASWEFDRIVPCHGDVIEKGGKGIFEKVMSWHIEAAKKQG
ncbi:hypothetical protein DOTSEDRAFT_34759 [Dothistroma septosporum NZE10]|uniref:Metallo-beta-lactamase domain-containing protein n=1 Tax=Dothistroma septosporum (strain NZE10 / CBS 128990) TaxID=675120 RepID=N1PLQ3_DOTSN|nr:hypothetical protein DOTSEDRAFT_34759 [Dothistroma septosporum NZE10]